MIEWFHEGAPVLGPHGDDHRIVLPDGSLFFLRALRGIDDGNYWCVASNLNLVAGASSSNRVARSRNATLRVSCKFHIPVKHYDCSGTWIGAIYFFFRMFNNFLIDLQQSTASYRMWKIERFYHSIIQRRFLDMCLKYLLSTSPPYH